MPKSFFLLLLLLINNACQSSQEETLRIATAANMQFAIKELTHVFTQQTGIKCTTIISSSGKLTAQIKEGAPYDVFISADLKFPEELYRNNLTNSKPATYAYGQLVLWTQKENLEPSLEILSTDNIQHIALANPRTAPYGQAAIEILKYNHLLQALKSKLVYGESIAQTNQFIHSQAAQIGFTAKSVVLSPQMKRQGRWIDLDTNSYTPIAQGVVLLKNKETQQAGAKQFHDFLFSATAKEILSNFGYLEGAKSSGTETQEF